MIKNYIKRTLYINKIEVFMQKDIIKVIVGQRRVGKSYLLFQIMDKLIEKGISKESIVYINKELHEFDHIKDYEDLLRYVKKHGGTAIFIDEIQGIHQFERALRDLCAIGIYDIYCSGSNADLLSGELATYLSGRYVEIEVHSLTYPEFLNFHRLDSSEDSFLKYLKYGGLPYLINIQLEDEVVYDYLRSVANTIILKDVVARYSIRNVAFLEGLIEFLADNVGSFVSAKRISDFLKSQRVNISPNVVLNYLHFLTSAFLVYKVPRAEIGGKKVFETRDKYYFQDCGLRHSIVGYKPSDVNKILENVVYTHLRASGYKVKVGQLGSHEIDFVCDRHNDRLYVQVTYLLHDENTWQREFGNLLKIKDNYPKIVVSMDKIIQGDEKGIRHMNILEFLRMIQ